MIVHLLCQHLAWNRIRPGPNRDDWPIRCPRNLACYRESPYHLIKCELIKVPPCSNLLFLWSSTITRQWGNWANYSVQ